MSRPPNLLFIMADDHAASAISAYGSRINRTLRMDQLAAEGMRFDACFCTNSICTPSRASILTGTYNHVNRVTTLRTLMDNRLQTFPQLLQKAGYRTGLVGKWHLGHGPRHDPTGFDHWQVLYDQGEYFHPTFRTPTGDRVVEGYATEVITEQGIDWLEALPSDAPFMLLLQHKAPHRPWHPAPKYRQLYQNHDIPEPHTFWDDYTTRSAAAASARCQMMDLKPEDLKAPIPAGLTQIEEISWRYQRYIKDYLRCISSLDESVGKALDYLNERGWSDDTVVVYTSDQGFFLGEHGWFDKRFIYEESLNMPLLIRYPLLISPGSVCSEIALNVDFAPTFLELAGVEIPSEMQGESLVPLLTGAAPKGWRTSMYYRYWMHDDPDHHIWSHYGVRTKSHKLIYFYNHGFGLPGTGRDGPEPEWELYDLDQDPFEVNNVYRTEEYQMVGEQLHQELDRWQARLGDTPAH